MAIAQQKVVDIETSGATKSLAELKKQINDAKNALYELTEGTEEYNDKIQELGYAQDELSSFMAQTRQGCAALEGSYNALSYQMSILKQEYKATADEARRAELAEQISGINDKLKEMDAAVGVFSRNVGNYTGAMNDVFGKLGINVGNLSPIFNTFANSAAEAGAKGQTAMQGLSAGAKGLGASLKSLAANPVGAVIMAIVVAVKALQTAFNAVKESVNRNEEAQDNLKKAMAPIKGIVQAITNVFDGFVEILTKAAAAIGGLVSGIMEFLGIAGEAVKLENEIADQQQANDELRRKTIVENARLELEASEARAKAADKEKYSNEQRLAFAKEYATKQQEIAANNLKQAEAELKLLELQAATGKNNAEMNDKLAEAQAKVLNVQTAYNNVLRQTNKEIAGIQKTIDDEAKSAQKAAADRAKQRATEVANMKKQFNQLVNSVSDDLIANEYEKQRVQARRSNEEQLKQFQDMLKKKVISLAEYNKAVAQSNQELNLQIYKINKEEQEYLENWVNGINSNFKSDALNKIEAERIKWEKKMLEVEEMYADGRIENDKLYWKAKEAIEKAGYAALQKVRDEEYIKQEQEQLKKQTDVDNAITANRLMNLEKEFTLRNLTLREYIEQQYNVQIEGNDKLIAAEQEYQSELNRLKEEGKISNDAYNAAMLESNNVLTELELANLELVRSKTEEMNDATLGALSTLMDTMSEFASNISSIGDGISSKWSNVFSNMSSMVDQVGVALKSNEKGFKKWGQVAAQACAAVSSMFGALADEQDENSVEGFEAAKKLRYAEAVFSMASGIMAVWPAAMQLGPIAGPVFGGIMTAMIAGMGAAQIASIAKTKYGDTSSSAAATPSASGISTSIQAPVQYSAEVVPNSQANNDDQNIYVSVTEIESVGHRVNVAENESRY